MIQLESNYIEAYLPQADVEEAMRSNEALLARAQRGEAEYEGSLGWHDPEKWASGEKLAQFCALGEEIRENAEVLVLLGVGGSNNAARAVIEALGSRLEVVYAGTSTSPYTIDKAIARCEGRSVYCIVIAKNFETLEPGIAFRSFRAYLRGRYGAAYARRILAIGTPGSSMEALCKENGIRFLPFATDIGGRFTAVSSVGLLPMAAAGVDIRALVQGAADMRSRLLREGAGENIALRYAVIRNLLYRRGYRVEMLSSFEPQLRWFYKWWVQLFAESEGKQGRGLYPTASEYSEDLHSVGQYVQDGYPDLFESFLYVKKQKTSFPLPKDAVQDGFEYLGAMDFAEINRVAFEATIAAHSTKVPCLRFNLDELDAYHFGQMFYFFEFSCYLSGRLLGVNPFDQPGVEAYKTLMFEKLGK